MSLLDMVFVTSKSIGSIQIPVTIEEKHNDELVIIDHPVEAGAAITDHAYRRPSEVVMQCGWSDSDYAALLGSLQVLFDGELPTASYVDGVYSQLIALQRSREPFDVVTSRRKYSNMLIAGLAVTTDAKTSAALIVVATLREIRIVQSRVTTLPPKANQANPASTAELVNMGVKSLVSAIPSPGGAVPPGAW